MKEHRCRRANGDEIHDALVEDVEMSWAVLGHRIGGHRTTVKRDVEPNGGRCGYRPVAADQRAVRCRRLVRGGTNRLGSPAGFRL